MRIIEIIGAAHNENIKSIAFINELTKSAISEPLGLKIRPTLFAHEGDY